jgi:hypothetical protein
MPTRRRVLHAGLLLLPALMAGPAAGTPHANKPRFYFKIIEVNIGNLEEPGLAATARSVLEKDLGSRPEFVADPALDAASDEETVAAELKKRDLRGFRVSLRVEQLSKNLEPPRPGGRLKQLAVATKLSVFGTTFPGEKLAFGGDGEAVVEAEVVESRLAAQTPALIEDVLTQAIKQAVDQTVTKLALPRAAPLNESKGKRKRR